MFGYYFDCTVIAVFGHFTLTVLLSLLRMSGNWIACSLAEVKSLIFKWAEYFHSSYFVSALFFLGLDINFTYVVYFSDFLLLVCFAIQTCTKNKYELCHIFLWACTWQSEYCRTNCNEIWGQGIFTKGQFTHAMPRPCRSPAMLCRINSHIPCHAPAIFWQCLCPSWNSAWKLGISELLMLQFNGLVYLC
jgi:hypothetical protein